MNDSSWENSNQWYREIVGQKGHFYHTEVVLPNALRLLNLKNNSTLLDVACGQGVLSRAIPQVSKYTGYDLSPSLVKEAQSLNKKKNFNFFVQDAEKKLPDDLGKFSHAACLLAIQNIPDPSKVFASVSPHIEEGGRFLIVMNHPYFRIPRLTGWQIDAAKKLQSRRVDRYMSHQKIPIQTNPSSKDSATTWSFHYPLSFFIESLKNNGFLIESIEEWCSNKQSTGKAAAQENRARLEFPMFMALVAVKKSLK